MHPVYDYPVNPNVYGGLTIPSSPPTLTQDIAIYSGTNGATSTVRISWSEVLGAERYDIYVNEEYVDSTTEFEYAVPTDNLYWFTVSVIPYRNDDPWGPTGYLDVNAIPGFTGFTWSRIGSNLVASTFTQGLPANGVSDIYSGLDSIGVIGLARSTDDLNAYLSGEANHIFDLAQWSTDKPAGFLDASNNTSLDAISGSGTARVFSVWTDNVSGISYISKPSPYVAYSA